MSAVQREIPLSLYIHVPWCVRKCPYCDFNSHARQGEIPERRFVAQLLADLEQDLPLCGDRPLESIFIGGGTPSLLSGGAVRELLDGVRARLPWGPQLEITLEANPGTAEAERFADYRDAGVNRLSLGIQSFDTEHLAALGRIHGPREARLAVGMAQAAGFDNINLDLMFALPRQSPAQARRDLEQALELAPAHLSYYQLTLEPNTLFHNRPPPLPDPDLCWRIQQQGQELLARHGYRQYEISAYSRPGRQCRHNLNYWRFGDYLGLGPGAHGLITRRDGSRLRLWKHRNPETYLQADPAELRAGERELDPEDLRIEFLMNALRLHEGFEPQLFGQRTGLQLTDLTPGLARARELGLLAPEGERIRASDRGYAFLNDLLALF
jgi:putative oxygen-independent coproporphyrinogen III oxidase